MRFWIDLGNSPHVLFFRPVIEILEGQGNEIRITACDFAQTIALADKMKMSHVIIGGHGGRSLHGKMANLLSRSSALVRWAYSENIDMAVSHNSYCQLVAALLLGIPSVTAMDYEYQPANHLSFRLARRVIVPEFFPEDALRLYGASLYKVRRYPGLKEEVYLSSFRPDPAFLSEAGLDNGKIIITVRPPATFALYHRFENPLFSELMDWLGKMDDVLIAFLPRTDEQKEIFLKKEYRNVFVPPHALDGPNLLFYSDLVISAGGTMNREAAVLGTPVYTVFAGRIAAVDNYLISRGRMVYIREKADFDRIRLCKRERVDFQPSESVALRRIVDFITEFGDG